MDETATIKVLFLQGHDFLNEDKEMVSEIMSPASGALGHIKHEITDPSVRAFYLWKIAAIYAAFHCDEPIRIPLNHCGRIFCGWFCGKNRVCGGQSDHACT